MRRIEELGFSTVAMAEHFYMSVNAGAGGQLPIGYANCPGTVGQPPRPGARPQRPDFAANEIASERLDACGGPRQPIRLDPRIVVRAWTGAETGGSQMKPVPVSHW